MTQLSSDDLKDSNMENYRSDEFTEMKHNIIEEKEKAFIGAGKEKGIQIWRIEKFRVKKWPKHRYGEFYGGDSYIILHTMKNNEGKLSWDVFYWLGAETTQDEAGTAAYKTVELDDLLNDAPIQYREVMGNESKRFLSLFTKMTILDGGISSGFHHVRAKQYKPRLLHICGFRRHVHVYQVPIKISSLNNSDCFILDLGLKIFQFNGEFASGFEKRKAGAIVSELKALRYGRVRCIYVIDGIKDKGGDKKLNKEFWSYFTDGSKKDIKKEDNINFVPNNIEISMHHVSDSTGKMVVKEVCRGKLDKNKLDSNDVFIIDGGLELFVWVGKGANNSEKKAGMKFAIRYLKSCGRNIDIPICRVIEGKETKNFWDIFEGKTGGGRKVNKVRWKSRKRIRN